MDRTDLFKKAYELNINPVLEWYGVADYIGVIGIQKGERVEYRLYADGRVEKVK
jgi:hypothetical protein